MAGTVLTVKRDVDNCDDVCEAHPRCVYAELDVNLRVCVLFATTNPTEVAYSRKTDIRPKLCGEKEIALTFECPNDHIFLAHG